MSGPSTSAEKNTASAQSQIGQTSYVNSEADRQRALDLQQPLVTKEQALSSGDAQEALRAAMPQITQISQGYKQAKDSIFSTIPPGAARDTALAQLQAQQSIAPAQAMATQVASAPEVLANVGSGMGAFSLQELGAGLSGYQGASTTQGNIVQQQTQAKGNTLNFLGSLAGAAGTAIGGRGGSDRKIKRGITPLDPALALRRGMRIPVMRYAYNAAPDEQRIGVIAQDVQEAFPQLVSESGGPHGHLQVDYFGLAAVAVAMAQELAGEVRALQQRVAALQAGSRQMERV